jgi:predicted ATPase
MIKSISFKNYKIFKEKQLLELKPITILFGKNNSGKSAVAKLPTLIEGALRSKSQAEFSIINDDVELCSEFRDLIYGKANRAVEFEIESIKTTLPESSVYKLLVGVGVAIDNYKQTPQIEYWKFNEEIDLHYENRQNVYKSSITDQEYFALFEGFYLTHLVKSENPDHSETIPSQYFKLQTDFIGPIRVRPDRDFRLSTLKVQKTGINGENAYQILIEDALTTEKKLLFDVSKWYEENFEGWKLTINQDRAPIYQVEIERNDLKQNIVDAGIGMSQVLPIVVRAMQPCYEETLIIIEEPEIHLHPAAHGNLAELFVESISQGNKKYLIETHSLNFILRLRRLVASKKINREDIALYYIDFSETDNCSSMKQVDIDDYGRVSDWPDGIFNETLSETIGIRTAQLENKNYGN